MDPTAGLRRRLRPLRRMVLARRRLLAALLAAIVVLLVLRVLAPAEPATVTVPVAARDLPVGTVLTTDDLTTERVAPNAVPAGVVPDPVGRTLAGDVRRGETVTDARLTGGDPTGGRTDLVAMPVRLPDASMVDLLRVGDRIDLVAADPQGGEATPAALGAVVLTVPAAQDGSASGLSGLPGRLVVLGVSPAEVDTVSQASVRDFLTFAWSR